jgi:hypothetical protein
MKKYKVKANSVKDFLEKYTKHKSITGDVVSYYGNK